ncbi:MAG TPA: hypothetical protein VGG44_02935 [Tepidisphaeraceae bacterium]
MGIRVENVESLVGVWVRRSIVWPDGREDRTTRVWWLQGKRYFADIRIPAGRLCFAGVRSLEQCELAQSKWLGTQEGFAGELVAADGAWMWRREIDFRLPTGKRDIGRLEFVDADRRVMIEDGVDEAYQEVWERIDDASSTNGEALVMGLRAKGELGLMVAVGEHFILAIDRRKDEGAANDPLDMEISHGRRNGALAEWVVEDSTFPWREGMRLFDVGQILVDWEERKMRERRTWAIVEPGVGKLDWIY